MADRLMGSVRELPSPVTVGGTEYSHFIAWDDQVSQTLRRQSVVVGTVERVVRDGTRARLVMARAGTLKVGGNIVAAREDQQVLGGDGGRRGAPWASRVLPGDITLVAADGVTRPMGWPVVAVEAHSAEPEEALAAWINENALQANWSTEDEQDPAVNTAHRHDVVVVEDPHDIFPDPGETGQPVSFVRGGLLVGEGDSGLHVAKHGAVAAEDWSAVPTGSRLHLPGLNLTLLASAWVASDLGPGLWCFSIQGDILFHDRARRAEMFNDLDAALMGLGNLHVAESGGGGLLPVSWGGTFAATIQPAGYELRYVGDLPPSNTPVYQRVPTEVLWSGMTYSNATSWAGPTSAHWRASSSGGDGRLCCFWGEDPSSAMLDIDVAGLPDPPFSGGSYVFGRPLAGGPAYLQPTPPWAAQTGISRAGARALRGGDWRASLSVEPIGLPLGELLRRLPTGATILDLRARIQLGGLRVRRSRSRGLEQFSTLYIGAGPYSEAGFGPQEGEDYRLNGELVYATGAFGSANLYSLATRNLSNNTSTGWEGLPFEHAGERLRLLVFAGVKNAAPATGWLESPGEEGAVPGSDSDVFRLVGAVEAVATEGGWSSLDLTPLAAALQAWRSGLEAYLFVWPVAEGFSPTLPEEFGLAEAFAALAPVAPVATQVEQPRGTVPVTGWTMAEVAAEWDTGELIEVSWEDLTIEPFEVRFNLGNVQSTLSIPRWEGPAAGVPPEP